MPTRHGTVKCTVYWPGEEDDRRPPVYVNVHGGGFVIAYPEQDDPWCRYLAVNAGVVVVNVDYGVAPKCRFPVALEQVYDLLRWAGEAERRWDGRRLCIGGQSAGGNLAAGVARRSLEERGPGILLQVLHYPVLDLATPAREKRTLARKPLLRPWMGEVFNTAYIPNQSRRLDRFASPARDENAQGLSGIAPALVVTAELDRLRDEGRAYADALDRAGSLIAYREVPGVDHGYDIVGGSEGAARATYEFIVEHIKRVTKP